MALGLNPDKFDPSVTEVQQIGKLLQLTIDKSDRTNKYRDIQAKRASLETSRKALTELKKQILKLEQAMHALGVNLGDFDVENEFVTVNVLLVETRRKVVRKIFDMETPARYLCLNSAGLYYALDRLAAAVFAGLVVAFLFGKGTRIIENTDQQGA